MGSKICRDSKLKRFDHTRAKLIGLLKQDKKKKTFRFGVGKLWFAEALPVDEMFLF